MFRNKKAIEISITAIIVAVMALLVLVVLSLVFTGKIGIVSKQVAECTTKGGKCFLANPGCGSIDIGSQNHPTMDPTTKCPDIGGESAVCCLPIPK